MAVTICYDGSPSAREAVVHAAAILQDHDVTLLHVWSPRSEELEPDRRADAEQVLAEGCQLATEQGLKVHGRLEPMHDTVWQTVLDISNETGSRLIVMGTRGHSPVDRRLLGSSASAVLRMATTPVLVVPTRVASGGVGQGSTGSRTEI